MARSAFGSQTAKKTIEVETLKQCTPLWHDSHVEIKITSGSEHFWKLWCSKSARRSGTKHISKSKCEKHTMLGPLLEVEMSRCCGAKHISKSTCAKHIMFGLLLKDVCVAGAKWVKTWGFPSPCKNDGGRGTFEEDLNYTVLITLYSILHGISLHFNYN